MVLVKIRINAAQKYYPDVDMHGLSINAPLDDEFWRDTPENKIGETNNAFIYEKVWDLPVGNHYLIYGTSCTRSYGWEAVIYLNGVEIGRGVDIKFTKPVHVDFTVEDLPTCGDHVTQESCEAAGCYWRDGACYPTVDVPDKCPKCGSENIASACIPGFCHWVCPDCGYEWWDPYDPALKNLAAGAVAGGAVGGGIVYAITRNLLVSAVGVGVGAAVGAVVGHIVQPLVTITCLNCQEQFKATSRELLWCPNCGEEILHLASEG